METKSWNDFLESYAHKVTSIRLEHALRDPTRSLLRDLVANGNQPLWCPNVTALETAFEWGCGRDERLTIGLFSANRIEEVKISRHHGEADVEHTIDAIKTFQIRPKRFILGRGRLQEPDEEFEDDPVRELDADAFEAVEEVHLCDVLCGAWRSLTGCRYLREVHITSSERYEDMDNEDDPDLVLRYPSLLTLTVDSHKLGSSPIIECEMPLLQRLIISKPADLYEDDILRFSRRCRSLTHLELKVTDFSEVDTSITALAPLINLRFLRLGGNWPYINTDDDEMDEFAKSLTKLEVLIFDFQATEGGPSIQITPASIQSLLEHCPHLWQIALPMNLERSEPLSDLNPSETVTTLKLDPISFPALPAEPHDDHFQGQKVNWMASIGQWHHRLEEVVRLLATAFPGVALLEIGDSSESVVGCVGRQERLRLSEAFTEHRQNLV